MAYGYNTVWGNTDNIDRNIAQLEAQIAGLGEGNYEQKDDLNKQIGALKNKKARQEWLGGMGQAATLANNVDPATLAGMLVGNLLGGALSRHLNRKPHSDAYKSDNTGGFGKQATQEIAAANSQLPGNPAATLDTQAWGSMADLTKAPGIPGTNAPLFDVDELLGKASFPIGG